MSKELNPALIEKGMLGKMINWSGVQGMLLRKLQLWQALPMETKLGHYVMLQRHP